MGLLKNLGIGYLAGELIGTVIDGISESINEEKEKAAEKERKKEEKIKQLNKLLELDTFDNDEYQRKVDAYIKDWAEDKDDMILGYYYNVSSMNSEQCKLCVNRS